MKTFVATPTEGFEGFIEDDGKRIAGIVTLFGEIYEPGESMAPHTKPKTLGELKAKFWDPATSSLRFPFGPNAFTIGPEDIDGLPDAAAISIRIMHRPLSDTTYGRDLDRFTIDEKAPQPP